MRTFGRFAQLGDHLITSHAGFDDGEVLFGHRMLHLGRHFLTRAVLMNLYQGVSQKQSNGSQGEQVDPQAALGEEGLSDFQPDDGLYLGPPKRVHRVTSSVPIRYS